MEQKKIERINELARKAKTPQGLTPEEMEQFCACLEKICDNLEHCDFTPL